MRNSLIGRTFALAACFSILFQGWSPVSASTTDFVNSSDVAEMSDAEGEALIKKVASESSKLHSIGKYKVGFRNQRGLAPIEKLWGVGLSLVGAMDSNTGVRPNIGVYDTELEGVHFEHETLKKESATYYEKRKAWLSKQETARWKRPLPYEVIHNDQNRVDGYRIGFEYELNGVSQVQMSYFLMCGKRMFHLKSLYASEKATSDGAVLSKAAETFYCETDLEKVGRFDRKEVSEFWKKAKSTPAGRAQAMEALREFFLQYEIEHQNIDTDDSELEARFEQIKTLFDRVFGVLSAFADGTEDSCFYAGWKSSLKQGAKGKRTCAEPEGLKNCGSGKLACNPSVFGNVCISDDFRQQATQVCHAEYLRESDQRNQEIAQIEKSNPRAFQEVQKAADGLCSKEPYASSNNSLCTALYNRIEKINPKSGARSSGSEPLGVDPSNYDEAFNTTQDLLQLVENHCMTPDKKSMYATVVVEGQVVECAKTREVALSNLKKLDAVKDTTNFKAVEDRACERLPPGFKSVKDTVKNMDAVLEPSCTAAEKAKRGNCGSDILCAAASSLSMGIPIKVGSCDTHRDNCLVNAATAIVKSLWETVKGLVKLTGQAISGLASDAYRGTKNLTKGVANFFGASYEIDDASSYKTVQFAKSAGGLVGDFIKDPGESIKKFLSGIWNGINQWMMEDAFCQEWSGAAHLSKCLKPSSGWQCLSCKEALNGTCAIMGYLASEIAGAFFTGGATAAIKMSGVGAKVASLLGKMSKAGKFAKVGLASKFPKLAKFASAGSKFLGKTGKVLTVGASKAITGSAKAIIRTLEKIPLVNIPVKVVKLGAEQGRKFIKWYAELNKKAFAAGSNGFRRPTQVGTKFAKIEAEGAAVASGERKLLAKEAPEAPKGEGVPKDQASASGSKDVSGGTTGGASSGKMIELSKDGKRAPDFREKVTSVKSGDQIKFSDGSTFQVKSRLGGEFSTEIFETVDGKVIRVNKRSNETGEWTVDSYRKGYEELKKTEIPIVKVLDPKKFSTEYVQVEKFNKKYDLDELYQKFRSGDVKLPEFQSKLEEFEKFIVKTKNYSELEDFHPGQIVYDQERGWLLADYGSHNKKFTGNGNATAVDRWGPYLPKEHLEHFQKVIRDARGVAP